MRLSEMMKLVFSVTKRDIHAWIFTQFRTGGTSSPSPLSAFSVRLLRHRARTRSHLLLYFTLHLPYSSLSRPSDTSEPPRLPEKCYANVPAFVLRSEEERRGK